MIDQQDKGLALLGRQLQTRSDTLGKERARFGVWPGANCFTAVVNKERKIEHKRVLQFLENLAIRNQLRIVRLRHGIKFIDAHQCVLVGRVTMKKLMLHQTCKLPEFGNVATKKIESMHHSENANCSGLLG